MMQSASKIMLFSFLLLGMVAQGVWADGNETLGPPSVTIADGNGIITAGIGLNTQPGTINVAVPADATIQQVLLYWEGGAPIDPAITSSISLFGFPVPGQNIGTTPFPVSSAQKTTFRADITNLGLIVPGNNSLLITAVDGLTNVVDGASVVVIINDNSGSSSDIQIRDGQDFAFIGLSVPPDPAAGLVTVPQTFTFAPETVARTAQLVLIVGSVGAPRENSLEYTVAGSTIGATTTTVSDPFVNNNGDEWDTLELGVNIPAGAETLTVQLFSRDDNPGEGADFPASLSWVGATFSLRLPPMACTGVIGDFIWNDLNRNGIQNVGEPGIEGVTRILRDEQGNEITRTTSGPDGSYQFNELCAGTYFVDLDTSTVPNGFQMTLIEQGGNPEFDSNDLTKPVVLATDTSEDLTIDCGFFKVNCPGKIGDFVWNDLNGNGIQDSGEPGIPGVVRILKDKDGNELQRTTTDNNGFYEFVNVPCDVEVTVEAEIPSGFALTLPEQGNDPTIDSNPPVSTVILTETNPINPTIDCGFVACQPCDGKATSLSLQYLGTSAAQISVVQKKPEETVFNEAVQPNGIFSFFGVGKKGTLSTEIKIFVNGNLATEIHTSCSQDLGPGLVFGKFLVVAGTSRNGGFMCPFDVASDCAAEGKNSAKIDKKKLEWEISNTGSGVLTVETITLVWPTANGNLKKIKLDGDIFKTEVAPPSATIDTFIGDLKDRQIKPGKKEKLTLEFKNDAVTDQGKYMIVVNFKEGCSVKFEFTSNGGGSFVCKDVKPIDALTMIWNGAETISVQAFDGSVGSTSLGVQTNVAPGDKVTFSGMGGSPNDQFWQITYPNSTTGQSKFHISCSDDEMDGPEDCGTAQGNGKNNESGLVNDWKFEGMSGQQSFGCSTP